MMKKKPGVHNAELLAEIALQSEITLFEEALPSLNDIFISYTTSPETTTETTPEAPASINTNKDEQS